MGTLLFTAAEGDERTITLNRDAAHDRLIALLAVAGGGRLAKGGMLHVRAALEEWRRGDKALAAIRLAFARLPRLHEPDDAYPLFLAETALDAGLASHDLVRELGYTPAIGPLLKGSPNQPRVPKGSGRASGQYTNGDYTGGGTSTRAPPTTLSTPKSKPTSGPQIVPVFLDTTREHDVKGGENETDFTPRPFSESIAEGRSLDFIIPGEHQYRFRRPR